MKSTSIFSKALKAIGIIVLINLFIIIFAINCLLGKVIFKQTEENANLIGYSLEKTLYHLLRNEKYSEIQNVFENIGANQSVRRIRLIQRSGIIAASSEVLEINSIRPEIPAILNEIINSRKLKVVQNDLGKNIYDLFIPVKSEKFYSETQDDLFGVLEVSIDVKEIKSQYQVFYIAFIALQTLFYIILGFCSLCLLWRYILTPLKKIESSIEEIIKGNYSNTVNYTNSDEIGSLVKLFNRMIYRINKRDEEFKKEIDIRVTIQDQLRIYKESLEAKIEERTQNLVVANKKLEEKNKELIELQAQIIQQEKLASIGQLAAGVAHELNNPMGFISGNFNALKKYINILINYFTLTKDDHELNNTALFEYWEKNNLDFILEDMPGLIHESEEGVERVISIVKNLKDFSRIDTNEGEEYDINKGIENTLLIARNEYKYVAEIEKEMSEVPLIKANGGEINQVLLNIIVNAAQAIEAMKYSEKKLIKIKTYYHHNNVYCEIEDNGPGIPEKIRDKIFDPFFTTKEPGRGTGLGLNIAYNIITKKHNGAIEVSSQEGIGTKFTIRLPLENRNKQGEDSL